MNTPDYEKILRNWKIEVQAVYASSELPGRPNQTTAQQVITDKAGDQWVLEIIGEQTYSRKLGIAETLEQLESHGCTSVLPYHRNSLGQFITCYSGNLFMLHPHIPGIPMPPDSWHIEDWRADAMADFIINLNTAASSISIPDDGKAFSIIDFVRRRMDAFKRHRTDLAESLIRVETELEQSLFSTLSTAPVAFCHGDLHPLDIVWGRDSIRAVIDWEHCGFKPEAYDAAVLVGCIGFHNPGALLSSFTTRFIQALRTAGIFSEVTWSQFFSLVLATRYSWLSEWMRVHDEKNRDLEMLYMNLLVTQKKYILKKWELG